MFYDGIARLSVPIADGVDALAPFRRLGLALLTAGDGSAYFAVGDEHGRFEVELIPGSNAPACITFSTSDIGGAVKALGGRGLNVELDERHARLKLPDEAAIDLRLTAVQQQEGPATSGFPFKRLDHLAAWPADLEATTHFWTEVLGVPLFGEVRTPRIVVRQFKVGDAIIELLGAGTDGTANPSRGTGLANMAAFEVSDMADAVARARTAGFSVADPSPGTLPGTRVTMIPAEALGGLRVQLLEYT